MQHVIQHREQPPQQPAQPLVLGLMFYPSYSWPYTLQGRYVTDPGLSDQGGWSLISESPPFKGCRIHGVNQCRSLPEGRGPEQGSVFEPTCAGESLQSRPTAPFWLGNVLCTSGGSLCCTPVCLGFPFIREGWYQSRQRVRIYCYHRNKIPQRNKKRTYSFKFSSAHHHPGHRNVEVLQSSPRHPSHLGPGLCLA